VWRIVKELPVAAQFECFKRSLYVVKTELASQQPVLPVGGAAFALPAGVTVAGTASNLPPATSALMKSTAAKPDGAAGGISAAAGISRPKSSSYVFAGTSRIG